MIWRSFSPSMAEQHNISKEQRINWNYMGAEDQAPYYSQSKNNSRKNPHKGKNRMLAYAVTLAWEGKTNG